MERKDVNINDVSPMMREYMNTKSMYEDTILFYRLGDFYEMFFEDAITASHALELTLTGKQAGLSERIPMCGIPHHASSFYIEKLIDKGYKVAICEQMEDPKTCKGIVKREVIEVISKGTITDPSLINEKDYNYIASITDYGYIYALSYVDILIGRPFTTLLEHDTNKLISYLVNLNIKEVVVCNDFNNQIINILKNNYNIFVSTSNNEFKDNKLFNKVNDEKLISNTNLLLGYIVLSQKKDISFFTDVEVINTDMFLELNSECIRNLELVETIRNKDRQNSLLGFLDKTKTAMGSRCLKSFIISPLKDRKLIEERHDLVNKFIDNFLFKSRLQELLYEIYDLERLCGKVAANNINPRDMLQLKNSIRVFPLINDVLNSLDIDKINEFHELYELLDKSISEDAPISIKEGSIIKSGYDKNLDELKSIRSNGKSFISNFEIEEKERTGIKTLKVGYNKVFGYYIEVSKGQIPLVKDEFMYERKQTLSNCERFITPLLKEKENMILNAEDKINSLEYDIFISIKEEVKKYINELKKVSSFISYLDVIQSFATVSENNNFIRPVISNSNNISIIEGRHPVVEANINNYIPNDIIMNENTNTLIITGPNMSGKSTYMRQLGVIAVLNQIGCFVPAKEAVLPIFDKIFTRIGASDDLASGESTFMVEMKESAYALNNATSKSLILFDELGRGTSTYDGMSLAGAILEYISKNIGCKTLFSTHYHELTEMSKKINSIKNVHVEINDNNGDITFLHKVLKGPVDKSYGINVAKLASLPQSVLVRSNELLHEYESKSSGNRVSIVQYQLDFDEKKDELREYLKTINVLETTPIKAIEILDNLKKMCK